jgi:hypothetical protein
VALWCVPVAARARLRQAPGMTTSQPQPRDIALEQESADLEADLEAKSRPDRAADDPAAEDPGTDDPAEISEGRS